MYMHHQTMADVRQWIYRLDHGKRKDPIQKMNIVKWQVMQLQIQQESKKEEGKKDELNDDITCRTSPTLVITPVDGKQTIGAQDQSAHVLTDLEDIKMIRRKRQRKRTKEKEEANEMCCVQSTVRNGTKRKKKTGRPRDQLICAFEKHLSNHKSEDCHHRKKPSKQKCILCRGKQQDKSQIAGYESCWVEISCPGQKKSIIYEEDQIVPAIVCFDLNLFEKELKEAKKITEHIVIGGDWNAHPSAWLDENIDEVGEHVSDFIINNNLNILNSSPHLRRRMEMMEDCHPLTSHCIRHQYSICAAIGEQTMMPITLNIRASWTSPQIKK
ncbi:hypothetical protein RFI_21684 [Reticulomyxa filosa]|uniref:Endonuclease/exonuclease/phosphatase domain-containing protein n=1 Tax=Reticulomyxa filosa TaxID=46433 RepID=X6MPS7_RETFI|nr:hypothetical protein RFI_21684 [Reticulomyxa filosa]|eukprot:ETO15681.1 hypothetical protein RFI_21684 [Reticulomyxa filosa]